MSDVAEHTIHDHVGHHVQHNVHDHLEANVRAIAEELLRQDPQLSREEAFHQAALSDAGRRLGQQSALAANPGDLYEGGPRSPQGQATHRHWLAGRSEQEAHDLAVMEHVRGCADCRGRVNECEHCPTTEEER